MIQRHVTFTNIVFCFNVFTILWMTSPAYAQNDSIKWFDVSGMKEWTLVQQSAGVKVYTRIMACNDSYGFAKNVLVFKVENLTKKFLAVDWDNQIYYNDRLNNAEGHLPEFHRRVALKPKQTFETNCDVAHQYFNYFVSLVEQESAERMTKIAFIHFKVYE